MVSGIASGPVGPSVSSGRYTRMLDQAPCTQLALSVADIWDKWRKWFGVTLIFKIQDIVRIAFLTTTFF